MRILVTETIFLCCYANKTKQKYPKHKALVPLTLFYASKHKGHTLSVDAQMPSVAMWQISESMIESFP